MKRLIAVAITLAVLAGIAFAGWRFWDHLYTRFTPEHCSVQNPDGDPVTLPRMLFLAMIVAGIVGLKALA